MKKTIYKYGTENELPISQGDIFCNLPHFSYDFLVRSEPNVTQKFDDESKEILEDILKNGGKIQIEGFFYCQWGILVSQDCDIRPNKDLIFLPLIPTESLLNVDNIVQTVENEIIKSTRRLYIPKINPLDDENSYGPFEIVFHNPFNVPYDLIFKNLKFCWKARLIEQARKIFIGKLSQFYSRTPVEEFIFLENKEITKYLISEWKSFWKEKSEKNFKKQIVKIEQLVDVLISVKRLQDLDKIFYFDSELIEKIKDFLFCIKWFNNAEELLTLISKIKNNILENPKKANKAFEKLIEKYIIIENCYYEKWVHFLEENDNKIKEIRKYKKKIKGIFPDERIKDVKGYIDYANGVNQAKGIIKNIPDYIKRYKDIFKILKKKMNNVYAEA